MNYHEKWSFGIFGPIGAFGGESGPQTLPTGFYSIFNEFLHWILIKFSQTVWPIRINF